MHAVREETTAPADQRGRPGSGRVHAADAAAQRVNTHGERSDGAGCLENLPAPSSTKRPMEDARARRPQFGHHAGNRPFPQVAREASRGHAGSVQEDAQGQPSDRGADQPDRKVPTLAELCRRARQHGRWLCSARNHAASRRYS